MLQRQRDLSGRRFVPVVHGELADRPDEAEVVATARAISDTLVGLGYDSAVLQLGLDLQAMGGLVERDPLVVFNLVEAIRGDGGLGHVACATFEHFGLTYTGAETAAYYQSASKLLTKTLLRAHGLPTPDWWTTAPPAGRTVIVKSVMEHGSFGMDHGSVVDASQAMAEIADRERRFGGRFFCEDYVAGREFNVSVLQTADGPIVLPIAEMCFDNLPAGIPAIVDYAAKWDDGSVGTRFMQRRFGLEQRTPLLADRIRSLTLSCWSAASLDGYARVDFRVDRSGAPFILEFNANPCLAPDAGFCAALDAAGIGYAAAIDAIVHAAHRSKRH